MDNLFSTEDMPTSVSVFVQSLSEGFVADVENSDSDSEWIEFSQFLLEFRSGRIFIFVRV